MASEPTRRALLGAILGGGVAGATLTDLSDVLDIAAPLSGRAWRSASAEVPDTVSSPHGDATVTYDDYHVPHVEADDEAAAYYAVGYAQAADRLFQMDLIRRRMDGRLAAAVGEFGVESDVLFTQLDFRAAAEATVDLLEGTRVEELGRAYAEGVNAFVDDGPDPLEFDLLDYEADPWDLVDILLVGRQISWGLTGSFNTLKRAVAREELGAETYERLYGRPFDHGAPIVREGTTGQVEGVDGFETPPGPRSTTEGATPSASSTVSVDPRLVADLAQHEPPPLLGSNHWAVSGEHTASGAPILAYDPHLTLMAPPVWYEQRIVVAEGDVDVRGVTFPGIPFVIVGENQHGAWGFTNTGADVIDFYTYETDGERYRYDGEWREFETETRTVEVADGEDRDVTVRKTVHGAYLERGVDGETFEVGVAWTGLSATREPAAIYEFSHATDVDEFAAALRQMDAPTQNVLYVDDEAVYYKVSGQIPIRRVDGEVVRGDRIFDGSAGEGKWAGFEPYGESSWEGFVPFEDRPGVRDPDYLGSANQRPVDEPTYPIGQEYASGFRGARIYERLDERVAGDQPVDRAFMQSVQRDTVDLRARALVPAILDARDRMRDGAGRWLDALADWDYRMDRDSAAALVFDRFYAHFRERTWADEFEDLDFEGRDLPQEWVLVTLPADDPVFDGDRAGVMAEAMADAVEEIDDEGWETYGDENRTSVDHQFGEQVPGLNYDRHPTDGTAYTVFNVHDDAVAGSSWRQVSPMDGDSASILPGGQDGSYFSEHYDDQLRAWADGEYKRMAFETPVDGEEITFRGESE